MSLERIPTTTTSNATMEREDLDLLERATRVNDADAYRDWELRCIERIASLRDECRDSRRLGTVGALLARVSRLTGARGLLRRRFAHEGAGRSSELSWSEIETAFRDRVTTGVVTNRDHIEPRRFLRDAEDTVIPRVRDDLRRHGGLKVNVIFSGEFVAGAKTDIKSIATRNHRLFGVSDLREWYERHVIDVILANLDEFQERDSGWALSRILNITVNINKFNPMHAGCFINLPLWIKRKGAVINVRSTDDACFAWTVVAALYPARGKVYRHTEYPHYSTVLNLEGIDFPMTLSQIGRFERMNDLSVNVFVIKEGAPNEIVPLRLTDGKRDRHVNVLYLHDFRRRWQDGGHFVLINNLSRLVGSQLSRHKSRKHICDRCLHYFSTSDGLSTHSVDCERMNDCAVILPSDDNRWLSFVNHSRKERLPFVVYADLECVIETNESGGDEETASIENATRRCAYQRHKVFSVGYYLCCARDATVPSIYRSQRGENCVSWFVEELRAIARRAKVALSAGKDVPTLSPDDERRFRTATNCHVCLRPFEEGDCRVRDHCHLSGRYRGPAHSNCNLNYKDSHVIPVFFHNLSGYDAHFIIRDVANRFAGRVDLLPVTKERYISFTKSVAETSCDGWDRCVKLRFVDSFKFLNTSLEQLASLLAKDKLRIARTEFSELEEEDFDLITRKGVFPYEYVDSIDKLRRTELPPREAFYSSLTGDNVSVDDYEHASTVWRRFRVKDLGEYSDLYLKTDVLLLADVFENFRDTCMSTYGLDPAHYYTLPGYAWDVMLKHTNARLELLTDIDMVLFVERGIRGGLSQCSNRYARANNKYMSSYDSSRASSFLMYLDVNNLYGWAMCEALPRANFQWVDDATSLDVMSVPSNSDTGYILEVDLEYPRELHDAHADLPFCPARGKPPGKRLDKLLATLHDKTSYVIHYRNLQQCVKHGLRLTKVHRALRFSQSPWLRDYIELNTACRTRARSDFDRNLYKLMNNAVFGKTMENVRDHVDVRLVTRWDGRHGGEALIARPNFHSRSVFSEELMAVELRRLQVKFNKPIYVGMCILEISKIRMYDFHYDYAKPLYGERCKLMYTDTDSFIYFLECEDAYGDLKRDIERFDTGNYPEDNPYGMPCVNRKVPGLMKDENNGSIMMEFVGLRSKMYATRVIGRSDTMKIKGIRRRIVGRRITFDDYLRCLNNMTEESRRQSCVRSSLHEVYTVSELKLALSPHDDKRYIAGCSGDTLPWGHYKIP